ncbi:hypothetical protein NB688_003203 [Xanthomonas sacchari]|uniref:Uncharacterized protein n=1 Tax=Xanthomonas sacchari TaxID=56458 RepID=A0ABT3DYC2_9XANT|nr:hypothetical protein [Xanthomonas sacchari]MCW0421037.1 hypothetical protein [Xanthomonas sacchari]
MRRKSIGNQWLALLQYIAEHGDAASGSTRRPQILLLGRSP